MVLRFHYKYLLNQRIAFLLTGFLLTFCPESKAQNKNTWFSDTLFFPHLTYDLLETQPYAGIFMMNTENADFKGAYIPVNLGFTKAIMQRSFKEFSVEFVFGAASYTQFEIIAYDANTLRGGLLNTDFKASGFFNLIKNEHALRFQIFHISSHLGDDYMLRNEAFERNNKTVNYEQVDIIYRYKTTWAAYYAGPGFVITPNAFRKRFMVQMGWQTYYPFSTTWGFTGGFDMKIYAQNSYFPDTHLGCGLTFSAKNKKQIDLGLDAFYGHLPYSTLNFGKLYWFGLSTHIYI